MKPSQSALTDVYRATDQNNFQVDDDAAAIDCHNRHWCVVYTKARSEDFAQVTLRQRGIVTFYPKLALPKSAKRNRQLVALFPNYLFVRLDLSSNEPGSVTWCPGVKRLLNFDGVPAIVDDSAVSFLMDQATPDATITACSNLRAGQEVIIEHGPFGGLIGIIERPPNARGRVKVLLQLLNRPTKVDVPVQFIKAGWMIHRN